MCVMTSSLSSPSKPAQRQSIRDIKADISRKALERQAAILRGEVDVPVTYAPLPVGELFELIDRIDYRQDFLNLAVPPARGSAVDRCKSFLKGMACAALRWVLIRQVEFNELVFQHARETTRQMVSADKNVADLSAALNVMKLQVQTLARRLAELEKPATPALPGVTGDSETCPGQEQVFRRFLEFVRDTGPVLVLGCGNGDLVCHLLAEGVAVAGVEPCEERADQCRELELPVIAADPAAYLASRADGFFSAIFVRLDVGEMPLARCADLLALCWPKLRGGGLVLLEARQAAVGLSAEFLAGLLASQGFTTVDQLFSDPDSPNDAAAVLASAGMPFDRKRYRRVAVIGRR
jgi:hypothetical protein